MRSYFQLTQRQARHQRIMEILEAGGAVTTQWLANKLEVSQRSIHRDIRALRDNGLRIGGCAGHGGGVMLRPERRQA